MAANVNFEQLGIRCSTKVKKSFYLPLPPTLIEQPAHIDDVRYCEGVVLWSSLSCSFLFLIRIRATVKDGSG